MIVGALYLVLVVLTIHWWAQTNPRGERLNLWRFFLIEAAVSGTLYYMGASILWSMGAIVLVMLMAYMHMYNYVSDDPKYRTDTFLNLAMLGFVSLFFGWWPLILIALFFTYTALGQEWWGKVMEKVPGPGR